MVWIERETRKRTGPQWCDGMGNKAHEPYSYLEDAIEGVEGDRRPRRQGFRGVVLVVECVHVLVQEFVGVKRPVHPVNLETPKAAKLEGKSASHS